MRGTLPFDDASIGRLLASSILIAIMISLLSQLNLQAFFTVSKTITQLEQQKQLQHIANAIIDDIQQAGFWQASLIYIGSSRPFTTNEPIILISEKAHEPYNSCISYQLYSKQHQKKQRRYGFRLNQGYIEYYQGPSTMFSCNSPLYWLPITNPATLNIANLQFFSAENSCINITTGLAYKGQTCDEISNEVLLQGIAIEVKQLDISLAAYLNDGSNDIIEINDTVRVQSRLSEPL